MEGITRPRLYDETPERKGFFDAIFQFVQRRTKIVTKTTNYSIEADVWIVRADATGGAITQTIPLSADWRGREIRLIKSDSGGNAVTVGRSGSDLIGGATSQSLAAQYDSITIVADGT